MDTKIYSTSGVVNSLQVASVKNIPAGDFNPAINFLIKNITDENITSTIITAAGDEVSTVLYPGWNPEICKGIKNVTENTLQYGY